MTSELVLIRTLSLQCARVGMDILTLGRYILETSLMVYPFTQQRDSLMASASLLLALTMKNAGTWVSVESVRNQRETDRSLFSCHVTMRSYK